MIKLNEVAKLIIGIIFVVIGIWLLVPSGWIPGIKQATYSGIPINLNWGDEFLTMLKGIVPPFLVVIGVLIVWIESEELKAPEVPEIEEEESEEETEE